MQVLGTSEAKKLLSKRNIGREMILNDELHIGMGCYAYVSTLKEFGVDYTIGRNPLFGHLTDEQASILIDYLFAVDGVIYVI